MIIVQDSQEKLPWNFRTYKEVEEQIITKIPTGDYTIHGYENEFIIERKKSMDELAINLGKFYTRFRNELIRMREFKEKYIICEFSIEDLINYPASSNIHKYSWKTKKPIEIRMRGSSMSKQINTITEIYGIEFKYCMNRANARETAFNLMKGFNERIRTQT